MKKLYLRSTLLLTIVLFSLHTEAQSDSGGRWAAGIVFSPDYAYRTIIYPDSVKRWKELQDKYEHPAFGYTTGVTLLYSLNKRLELESGLLYSAKGYVVKLPGEEGWHLPDELSDEGGQINDPLLPDEANTIFNYRYLDVPFKVNWFFYQSRVRFFLSAGVTGSFFLDEFTEEKLIFDDRIETTRYNEEDVTFNPVVLSLTGGAGIEYPLTGKLRIRVNPEVRHAVTPLADTFGKCYLWSAGINTSVFFKLRKGGTSSHPRLK